ncbi:MAG: cytochrome c [Gammaproteobacteria bacterium]|nr:cytochrome c [Gammaproteobacteria bacterium]
MRHRVLPALLACAVLSVPAVAVSATAPADAIKYRKAVMAALSNHVSAFMLVNFGKVEHQGHLKAHANAIADLGTQAKVLFPAGTDAGDTDALPLIWKEPDKFRKLLGDLEASSAKLRDAVAANDKPGTLAAFKAMGEACKGCHDRYRKADD